MRYVKLINDNMIKIKSYLDELKDFSKKDVHDKVLYKLLYTLSNEDQIEITKFLLKKYLPLFYKNWPEYTEAGMLLENLNENSKKLDLSRIIDNDQFNRADGSFIFDIFVLKQSIEQEVNRRYSTLWRVYLLYSAVNNFMENAWIEYHLEDYKKWEKENYEYESAYEQKREDVEGIWPHPQYKHFPEVIEVEKEVWGLLIGFIDNNNFSYLQHSDEEIREMELFIEFLDRENKGYYPFLFSELNEEEFYEWKVKNGFLTDYISTKVLNSTLYLLKSEKYELLGKMKIDIGKTIIDISDFPIDIRNGLDCYFQSIYFFKAALLNILKGYFNQMENNFSKPEKLESLCSYLDKSIHGLTEVKEGIERKLSDHSLLEDVKIQSNLTLHGIKENSKPHTPEEVKMAIMEFIDISNFIRTAYNLFSEKGIKF